MGSSSEGKIRVSDYHLATHLGVCHGPVDAVRRILVGEKVAWTGAATPADADPVNGQDITISNNGLFGGNKKEGGVEGTMTVLHGEDAQLAPEKMAALIGTPRGDMPGYRGILSLFFHGLPDWGRNGFKWGSNNPYLKAVWVTVTRTPKTWYPEAATIPNAEFPDSPDANPIHVIRECLTNRMWGMSAPASAFNDDELRAAADVMVAEQFGLSLLWAEQSSIEDFVKDILDHINGTIGINPKTGKYRIKLIRDDYSVESLPVITRDHARLLTSQRKTWSETSNEMSVSWTSPDTEDAETVTVHDPANISIQGRIVTDSRNYHGIRNAELATTVAMRELQAASQALMQVEMECDRSAFELLAGDPVVLSGWKELEFESLVMRVVTIDYGKADSMAIKVGLVEDVFGTPVVYTSTDPGKWKDQGEAPVPMQSVEIATVPYYLLTKFKGEQSAQNVAYPEAYAMVLAAPEGRDTFVYNQQARRGDITGSGVTWDNSYDRKPLGHGKLAAAIPAAVESTLAITAFKGCVYADVGKYIMLGGAGGEMVLITGISSGSVTVRRGCLDTSPQPWPESTVLWILDNDVHGFDHVASSVGAAPAYRLLPITSKGQLQESLAPVISGQITDRHYRPYRPANVRFNGALFPAHADFPVNVTWAERNRLLETSVILSWDAAGVVPEDGTAYNLTVDAYVGDAWVSDVIRLTKAQVTALAITADMLPSNTTGLRVTLGSERGGLPSWSTFTWSLSVGDSGTGLPPGSSTELKPPPAPVSATVTAGRTTMGIIPGFASTSTHPCEFWRSRVALSLSEIESSATLVGSSATITDTGLLIDTPYWYYLRAVNAYGKSDWFTLETRTKIDPQSVLDEMDGMISESQLTEELRSTIHAPSADLSALNSAMSALNAALAETESALAALDAREAGVNASLSQAQDALGENYVNVTLITESLRNRIDRYNLDFQDFRDAVFSVDPSTGEITMEAVNAVRSELGAQISVVSQHLDAVEAIVNTCVTRAEIQGDLERITSVEQDLDGVKGTLLQTATKSELTAVSQTVTQVSQGLDATNAALAQKAAQTTVTAQGERLSVAEQQISANTTANTATALRIDNLAVELRNADSQIKSQITSLAQAVATENSAMAQRITGLEALTGQQSASITELQQVITGGDGSSLAAKLDVLTASTNLGAEAAVNNALANADADMQQRKSTGKIRVSQEVMSNDLKAQAQTIVALTAEFDAEQASTSAALTEVRTTMSTVDQALSQRIDNMDAAYKDADSQTNSTLSTLAQTVSTVDQALSQRIDNMDAAYKAADSQTNANVSDLAQAAASADQALAEQISQTNASVNGLSSTVQTHSQSIASLEGGAQAMWSAKAQAGEITAGIGIVATSDGKSQVAVNASQFFVFDSNSNTPMQSIFAIDQGQVIIRQAVIQKAWVDIMNATSITATYVKANVSLSSPAISGGSISGTSISIGAGAFIVDGNGNVSMTKGYINLGNGAFVVDAAGNLTATKGTFSGEVFAKNINGDLNATKMISVSMSESVYQKSPISGLIVKAADYARDITVDGISVDLAEYAFPYAAGALVLRTQLRRGTTIVSTSEIRFVRPAGTSFKKVLTARTVAAPIAVYNGAPTTQQTYEVTVALYWDPDSGSPSYEVAAFALSGAARFNVSKTATDTFG